MKQLNLNRESHLHTQHVPTINCSRIEQLPNKKHLRQEIWIMRLAKKHMEQLFYGNAAITQYCFPILSFSHDHRARVKESCKSYTLLIERKIA